MRREQDRSTSTPHITGLASTDEMREEVARPRTGYERPTLTVLGSVGDVTRGGNVSENSDGFGAAGASGVLS